MQPGVCIKTTQVILVASSSHLVMLQLFMLPTGYAQHNMEWGHSLHLPAVLSCVLVYPNICLVPNISSLKGKPCEQVHSCANMEDLPACRRVHSHAKCKNGIVAMGDV